MMKMHYLTWTGDLYETKIDSRILEDFDRGSDGRMRVTSFFTLVSDQEKAMENFQNVSEPSSSSASASGSSSPVVVILSLSLLPLV